MRNVIRMVGVGIAALCMVTSTVQGTGEIECQQH